MTKRNIFKSLVKTCIFAKKMKYSLFTLLYSKFSNLLNYNGSY